MDTDETQTRKFIRRAGVQEENATAGPIPAALLLSL
jgi:hypothetical protein